MKPLKIGVLAFHGDVIEHIQALEKAAKILKRKIEIVQVRTKDSLGDLEGLIIPGGESTTLYKLCEREGMIPPMKKIKNIFGTCAGAIMIAKNVANKTEDQKTLELLDVDIDRNAYGRQTDSFVEKIKTSLGEVNAVFIRAPKIRKISAKVKILAENKGEILACEQKSESGYYLAACFHPELTSTVFHEHFIKQL